MTNENYKFLKKFEENFRTATRHGYSRRIMPSDMLRIVEVYNQITGSKEVAPCANCSRGPVTLLQRVAKVFFAAQEKHKEAGVQADTQEVAPTEVVKPKRGRKPKVQE